MQKYSTDDVQCQAHTTHDQYQFRIFDLYNENTNQLTFQLLKDEKKEGKTYSEEK